jgi:hypothetical protein
LNEFLYHHLFYPLKHPQTILFLNFLFAATKTKRPKIERSTVSKTRNFSELPLRNIPFKIVTKYLAGIIWVNIWRGLGMFDIENIKPERRNAGRKVVINAIWLATSWDFADMEMSMPG